MSDFVILKSLDLYIGLGIAGIFTGIGSALGTYFAQRGIIKQIEYLKKRIKRRFK